MLSWCVRRSEKSQVLNEEQQSLEKRVDQLRLACQNVSKKVQTCLMTQGKSTDSDKRLVLHSYTTTKNLILLLQLWPVVSIQIYLKVNVRGAEIRGKARSTGVGSGSVGVPSLVWESRLCLWEICEILLANLYILLHFASFGATKKLLPQYFFLGHLSLISRDWCRWLLWQLFLLLLLLLLLLWLQYCYWPQSCCLNWFSRSVTDPMSILPGTFYLFCYFLYIVGYTQYIYSPESLFKCWYCDGRNGHNNQLLG